MSERRRRVSDLTRKARGVMGEPKTLTESLRILEAWIQDRRAQYSPDGAIQAAFDELIESIREGEPFTSYDHGELEDLMSESPSPNRSSASFASLYKVIPGGGDVVWLWSETGGYQLGVRLDHDKYEDINGQLITHRPTHWAKAVPPGSPEVPAQVMAIICDCYERTKGMRLYSTEESDVYWETMETIMQMVAALRGEELDRAPEEGGA